MESLHFCGGLPRSGSTVLMNILQQNPRIFTTATCALTDLLHQHVLVKSRFRESFQAMNVDQADSAMYGFIQGGTRGWFEGLTDKPIVVSKNRAWSNLLHLYPDSKYICMVRDLRDIVDSFERLNNRTKALHSFNEMSIMYPALTDVEKFNYFFNSNGNSVQDVLRTELPRLMEMFSKGNQNILFVRYEDFTTDPYYILNRIYSFINETLFEHDLENIQQSKIFEHDHAYFREKTDHVTQPKFKRYTKPERVISKVLQDEIVKNFKWFYEGFYPDEINPYN